MAYIKKEPIIEFITKGLNNPEKTKAFGYDAIEILAEIEHAPTADVVEVRGGEWIVHENDGCWHYDCPFCDDGFAIKAKMPTPPNYCENCGAKMDGEREENKKFGKFLIDKSANGVIGICDIPDYLVELSERKENK